MAKSDIGYRRYCERDITEMIANVVGGFIGLK